MPSPIAFAGDVTLAMQSKDRQRSIAWYSEHLAFTLLYDVAEIGWCELQSPVAGVTFGFSQVETPKVGAGPTPVFGVRDIDAARAYMESIGTRFDGATRTIPGLVRLATFYDPDGNTLMFSQSLQAH